MIIKSFAIAAIVVAHPIVAHAGRHCGDSSSGDGGSSDHSSNSNSSSSSSNETSWSASSTGGGVGSDSPATGCLDDSDVVGYRHCSKFGSGWGMNPRMPRLFVELGTNVRQFGVGATGQTGTVWHGSENFTLRMVDAPTAEASASAVASTMRIGIGLGRGMYAGLEGELGGLTSAPAQVEMMSTGVYGSPELSNRTALLMGGAGFLGARVSSGRASLSLEGAGGARDVRYRYTSTYHNCEDVAVVSVVQPVLEARARAEVWLNPWFTVGAQAGANVASRGDWMTGLYLGVHSRAFGGR